MSTRADALTEHLSHTPGPWIARYADRVTRSDDTDGTKSIAHVYSVRGSDEGRANQLLIAAAPDMLAALKRLYDVSGKSRDISDARRQAEEAIAKAEGG